MSTRIRCHCRGKPACKLCGGMKFYEYAPGPRGWLPFTCPTCEGAGVLPDGTDGKSPCFTCSGAGSVDPADPPYAPGWRGVLRVVWKVFFGGG